MFEIIWSPEAEITFYDILEYLYQNWPEQVSAGFIVRTEEILAYIKENPQYYPYSRESDSYRCVLRKQVSLFYRVKNNQIELLMFWDNRRDPNKLKLL